MDDTPTTRPSLLVCLRNLQDQQSWEEFYAIYQPLVFRMARSQGFQDADASELTQEVFVAVASAIRLDLPDCVSWLECRVHFGYDTVSSDAFSQIEALRIYT